MEGMHLTPISKGAVLLEPNPSLNPEEPDNYGTDLMDYLQTRRASLLIYDLRKLPIIDESYYQWLCYVNAICQLNNTQMVVIHMQPTAAYGLAQFLTEAVPFKAALDVEQAQRGEWV